VSSGLRRGAEELPSDIPFGSGCDTWATPQRLRFSNPGTPVAPAARSRTVQAVKTALHRMSGQRWPQLQSEGSIWRSLGCQTYQRQQTPYRCQSRNHGLLACLSSCRRFTAARSLALSGLTSGSAKMPSSRSISEMVCSASIRLHHLARSGKWLNGAASGFS
jgi:hypothetical protein